MEKLYIVENSYNGEITNRLYTTNAAKAKEKFKESKMELLARFRDKLVSEFPIEEVCNSETYQEFRLHVGYYDQYVVTLTVAELE